MESIRVSGAGLPAIMEQLVFFEGVLVGWRLPIAARPANQEALAAFLPQARVGNKDLSAALVLHPNTGDFRSVGASSVGKQIGFAAVKCALAVLLIWPDRFGLLGHERLGKQNSRGLGQEFLAAVRTVCGAGVEGNVGAVAAGLVFLVQVGYRGPIEVQADHLILLSVHVDGVAGRVLAERDAHAPQDRPFHLVLCYQSGGVRRKSIGRKETLIRPARAPAQIRPRGSTSEPGSSSRRPPANRGRRDAVLWGSKTRRCCCRVCQWFALPGLAYPGRRSCRAACRSHKFAGRRNRRRCQWAV